MAQYIGVEGVSRAVKAGYIGVAGVARQFTPGMEVVTGTFTPTSNYGPHSIPDIAGKSHVIFLINADSVALYEINWNLLWGYFENNTLHEFCILNSTAHMYSYPATIDSSGNLSQTSALFSTSFSYTYYAW